jgi:hypothetical protein
MNEAKPNGDVTICVVHYRTPELVCRDCFSERDLEKGKSFVFNGAGKGTVGKKLYFELVDRGCQTVELPDSVLGRYVWHLAHTTRVLNAEMYNLRRRSRRKRKKCIEKNLENAAGAVDSAG